MEEREKGKYMIDCYSSLLTIRLDRLTRYVEISEDLGDGEEEFYVKTFSKFMRATDNYSEYMLSLAYIQEALNILESLPLHEYNYHCLLEKAEQLNSLIEKTEKKDIYSEKYEAPEPHKFS